MATERQKAIENAAKPPRPPKHPGAASENSHLNDNTSILSPLAEKLAARSPTLRADVPAPNTPEGRALAEQLAADEKAERAKDLAAARLDPDPAGRVIWEREMVIRAIQRRGRMTKEDRLKREERSLFWRSEAVQGSVKKLTKIMNQIAGKTVDEAMVQLRFSKKRAAQDILRGLQIARATAVAERGMGLGEKKRVTVDETGAEVLPVGDFLAPRAREGKVIELKDGSKKVVSDPTEIYVDQAWVGRGEVEKGVEHRAKGRMNTLLHRTTNFAFILKEEKTRMRISDEIQAKREKKKVWTALPDRPVIAQKQYCLW